MSLYNFIFFFFFFFFFTTSCHSVTESHHIVTITIKSLQGQDDARPSSPPRSFNDNDNNNLRHHIPHQWTTQHQATNMATPTTSESALSLETRHNEWPPQQPTPQWTHNTLAGMTTTVVLPQDRNRGMDGLGGTRLAGMSFIYLYLFSIY